MSRSGTVHLVCLDSCAARCLEDGVEAKRSDRVVLGVARTVSWVLFGVRRPELGAGRDRPLELRQPLLGHSHLPRRPYRHRTGRTRHTQPHHAARRHSTRQHLRYQGRYLPRRGECPGHGTVVAACVIVPSLKLRLAAKGKPPRGQVDGRRMPLGVYASIRP